MAEGVGLLSLPGTRLDPWRSQCPVLQLVSFLPLPGQARIRHSRAELPWQHRFWPFFPGGQPRLLGGGDTLDWLNSVSFLKELGYIDPDRVVIWGSGYGGFAVLLALAKLPNVFKAGICFYGASDLVQSYEDTRA